GQYLNDRVSLLFNNETLFPLVLTYSVKIRSFLLSDTSKELKKTSNNRNWVGKFTQVLEKVKPDRGSVAKPSGKDTFIHPFAFALSVLATAGLTQIYSLLRSFAT